MPDEKPDTPAEKAKINMDQSDENCFFDKEETYRTIIRPALEQFQKLCQEHEIPMVTAVCSHNNADTMDVTTAGAWGKNNFVPRPFYFVRAVIKDTENFDQIAAFARLLGMKF